MFITSYLKWPSCWRWLRNIVCLGRSNTVWWKTTWQYQGSGTRRKDWAFEWDLEPKYPERHDSGCWLGEKRHRLDFFEFIGCLIRKDPTSKKCTTLILCRLYFWFIDCQRCRGHFNEYLNIRPYSENCSLKKTFEESLKCWLLNALLSETF